MNLAQKLADIQTMIAYIKEHVDTTPAAIDNIHLDEIGKSVLVMVEQLRTIERNTGDGANKRAEEYLVHVDTQAEAIVEQLKEIKIAIENEKETSNQLVAKVEDVYSEYMGNLKESESALAVQKQNYEKALGDIQSELKTLQNLTISLDEKIISEDQLIQHIAKIDAQLEAVIWQDSEINETHEKEMTALTERMDRIQQSYDELNQTMLAVDESFKTAVSRLNILLMQMNILTKKNGGR